MNISTRKTIIELCMDIIQEVVSEKRGVVSGREKDWHLAMEVPCFLKCVVDKEI